MCIILADTQDLCKYPRCHSVPNTCRVDTTNIILAMRETFSETIATNVHKNPARQCKLCVILATTSPQASFTMRKADYNVPRLTTVGG